VAWVDHRAYAFCVLEHLHRALRRRDVYAEGSDCWSDPRARLLDGEAWQRAMPEVITALSLSETPDPHLTELAGRLDVAYRDLATRLPDNAALELTNEGARISPRPIRGCAGTCFPGGTSRHRRTHAPQGRSP